MVKRIASDWGAIGKLRERSKQLQIEHGAETSATPGLEFVVVCLGKGPHHAGGRLDLDRLATPAEKLPRPLHHGDEAHRETSSSFFSGILSAAATSATRKKLGPCRFLPGFAGARSVLRVS